MPPAPMATRRRPGPRASPASGTDLAAAAGRFRRSQPVEAARCRPPCAQDRPRMTTRQARSRTMQQWRLRRLAVADQAGVATGSGRPLPARRRTGSGRSDEAKSESRPRISHSISRSAALPILRMWWMPNHATTATIGMLIPVARSGSTCTPVDSQRLGRMADQGRDVISHRRDRQTLDRRLQPQLQPRAAVHRFQQRLVLPLRASGRPGWTAAGLRVPRAATTIPAARRPTGRCSSPGPGGVR